MLPASWAWALQSEKPTHCDKEPAHHKKTQSSQVNKLECKKKKFGLTLPPLYQFLKLWWHYLFFTCCRRIWILPFLLQFLVFTVFGAGSLIRLQMHSRMKLVAAAFHITVVVDPGGGVIVQLALLSKWRGQ